MMGHMAGTPTPTLEALRAYIAAQRLGEHADVDIASVADGQVLAYSVASGNWENATAASGTLAGLTDVSLTSLSNGQFLTYDSGSGMWVNVTITLDLNSLSDVSISSPATADVLAYTGAGWQNIASSSFLVLTTGDQTILGVKTFFTEARIRQGAKLSFADSNGSHQVDVVFSSDIGATYTITIPNPGGNAAFVLTTATQTIGGVKTFSDFPVTPSAAPTTDYQVANKKYVDDNAGSMSNLSDVIAEGVTSIYYISPTGSDTTGTGAVGNPWATLAYAFGQLDNLLVAGTLRIQLAAGAYAFAATATVTSAPTTYGPGVVEVLGDTANPQNYRQTMLAGGNTHSVASISNPAGTTFRYNLSGTPDLTVVVDNQSQALVRGCTNPLNDGYFTITGHGNYYVDVTNASGATQAGAAGTLGATRNLNTCLEFQIATPTRIVFRGIEFQGSKGAGPNSGCVVNDHYLEFANCMFRWAITGLSTRRGGRSLLTDCTVANNQRGVYSHGAGQTIIVNGSGASFQYGVVSQWLGYTLRGGITGDVANFTNQNGGLTE